MLACLDLEGVLLPEIWIAFAEKTGIEKLKLTTREIPNYDELMQGRLKILNDNNLKLIDIQNVIKTLSPLAGAIDFLTWLKSEFQVIILSDTFYQFVGPLMQSLDYPTLFCHELTVDSKGNITNYRLRQKDSKTKVVSALKKLNFKIFAAKGTAMFLSKFAIKVYSIKKVNEGSPHIVDLIKDNKIHMIINTTSGSKSVADSLSIRRTALRTKIPYFTTISAAKIAVTGLNIINENEINVKSIQELYKS